ncbi:MAG: hypothetical protein AB7G62_17945 [Magnetospirillum sp.]
MKVYIANFGRENYLWPTCLERGTIATMDDEEVHPFWLRRDKQGYIDFCMTKLRTARGIAVTKPVASRWFNLLDILMETQGDLWIHRQKDMLWWTVSTQQEATSSVELDHKPLRAGARVHVYHKPCTGWSNKDKQGRKLTWAGLHPKAREFLFTEGTFQCLSEDNAAFALALIEGQELTGWHGQKDWKAKEQKAAKSSVTTYSAQQRTVFRIVRTVMETVATSNGQDVTSTRKNKEVMFSEAELGEYVSALLDRQEGLCALTGIKMQLDGEEDDKQLLCSLDRINSDGHYEAENLQLVCRFVNFWKRDQKDDEFRRLLDLVQRAAS